MGRGVVGCLAPVFLVVGVLFALGFAGAAYLVAQLPGDDAPSPVPFALAGVGGLLVFWGVALVGLRLAMPRRARGLAVAVDRQRLRRGESVAARLTAGDPGAELGLVCRVHHDEISRMHDGTSRVTMVDVAWEAWQPAGALGATLTVPVDGPPSYEGSVLSFAWAVHARPAGGGTPSAPAPVWVEP